MRGGGLQDKKVEGVRLVPGGRPLFMLGDDQKVIVRVLVGKPIHSGAPDVKKNPPKEAARKIGR